MSDRLGYKTKIWLEEPSANNPFVADRCFSHGYNVYEEVIHKASWAEYLYLTMTGQRPDSRQSELLERLAVALLNLGPREPSIRAAMNGGVAGSPHAASLMTALSVGSGQCGGSHEVFILMELWERCGQSLEQWKNGLQHPVQDEREDIWPLMEHPPGFDPNGSHCPLPFIQTLEALCKLDDKGDLIWLAEHRNELERLMDKPISFSAVAAAAFSSLGLNEHSAAMLFLILRLPGAAAHAIEQRSLGWKNFPFYADKIRLTDDPGPIQTLNEDEVGL